MKKNLIALRKEMKNNNLKAYIVPTSDPHMSEYLAEHWHCRKWLSGFTGSAGTVVVTGNKAGLWTDGRYYIQAEDELKGSGIDLFKLYSPGVPDHVTWLQDELEKGDLIGINSRIISVTSFKNMKKKFDLKEIEIETKYDPIDLIWKERPELPEEKVFALETKFSGKSRILKMEELRTELQKKEIDHYLISSLDEIAWLLNIRGNDIAFSPVAIAYAVVSLKKTHLFVSLSKINDDLMKELENDDIQIHNYSEIGDFLKNINDKDKICYVPGTTNQWLVEQINETSEKIERKSLIAVNQSKKNPIEIENLKKCLERDCIALVKFFFWLKNNLGKLKITEISAADKLAEIRAMQNNFMGLSFPSISAYGANAAMMHYSPKIGSDAVLEQEGFYLIDSGGHYLDGTTDITRTLALGHLTEEQKRDFTLVLKAHIGLTIAHFLKGTTGANLDILARQPLWREGLDYKCGTGHGVGFFLNVHEGPQNFSQVLVNVPFEIGMVTTNEPGIYRKDKHGIRTENMLLTVSDKTTESGEFLKFETLSFCPIDIDALLPELLTLEEKNWLNSYHKQVFSILSGSLEPAEKEWLKENTRPI